MDKMIGVDNKVVISSDQLVTKVTKLLKYSYVSSLKVENKVPTCLQKFRQLIIRIIGIV